MRDQKILFFGAGEAGIGIADMIVAALQREGLSVMEARDRVWFLDSKGLVIKNRSELSDEKRRFAHEHEFVSDHLSAINALRPTAIIGVSGRAGIFTPLLARMAQIHERPDLGGGGFGLRSRPGASLSSAAQDSRRFLGNCGGHRPSGLRPGIGKSAETGGSTRAHQIGNVRAFVPELYLIGSNYWFHSHFFHHVFLQFAV